MVILTNESGNEIRTIQFDKLDVDLNATRDFELTIEESEYLDDFKKNGRIFVENTEYGGLIGELGGSTLQGERYVRGLSWRGVLYKKVISPRTLSGELNAVINTLISQCGLSGLFQVAGGTGVLINYNVESYCTLLDVLEGMLESVGYRLKIIYVQQERGVPGHVELSSVKIVDYSQNIEFSQDTQFDFTFDIKNNGVNHLICIGKDGLIVDLYVQQNGRIGTTQYYTGIDCIEEIFVSESIETEEELEEEGRERLYDIKSKQSFSISINELKNDVEIGDIVGGRDYITGTLIQKPIVNKICVIENDTMTIEYELKGEDE